MPSPAKTTDAQIIAAARKLVESHGADGLSMNDVAAAVGVRAPSLYGRFAHRAQILAGVKIACWRDLERELASAQSEDDPVGALVAQARAYRTFAKANPGGYALMFDAEAERTADGARASAAALAPTLPGFVALAGKDRALLAARVLTPFLHGFISMELAGAFRLGGGLDEAFEHGVTTILAGLGAEKFRRSSSRPRRGRRSRKLDQ